MTSTNKHGKIRTATVEPFIKNKAKRAKFLKEGTLRQLLVPSLVVGGHNVNRFLELAYQRREACSWRRLNRNLFLRIPPPYVVERHSSRQVEIRATS
jgi:hypothetical protein